MTARVIVVILVVALGACSGLGEKVSRIGRGDATLDSAQVAESTAQAQRAESVATSTALPNPVDSAVRWQDLTGMIRATPESIRGVMQTHDRKVTVVYLDGRRYHATQPAMDEILALLRQVDPAGRILIATE